MSSDHRFRHYNTIFLLLGSLGYTTTYLFFCWLICNGKPSLTLLHGLQGVALHDMLERISGITLSKNCLTTSFLNLLLNHCSLEIRDIHMQVQFSMATDSFRCSLGMKELSVKSQDLKRGCLLRGLIYLLFSPLKESSLVIDGRGFDIRLEREEHMNHVLSSVDLFACIKMIDLQPLDISLQVPHVRFSLSPLDLPIIVAFDRLFSQGSKRVRNGQQLWRIASSRIGFLIPVPRFSLARLIRIVALWTRHANTYGYLLSLIGYPADHLVKRSAVKMSDDKIFTSCVKHNWNVISEIEKDLPVEAIAQARRVARCKAALNVHRAGDVYLESLVNNHFKFISKIISLLNVAWKLIFGILHLLLHSLCLRNLFSKHKKVDSLGIASDGYCPWCCFSLSMGKVSLVVSPVNVGKAPVGEKLESDNRIFHSDLLSFCISIDILLLIYEEEVGKQRVSFSCGGLKVTSSSYMENLFGERGSRNPFSFLNGHQKKRVNDSQTILWSEPAQMFLLENSTTTAHAESASLSFLENILGEMSLSWQRTCMKFEGGEIQFLENPCILLEIKSFLTSLDLRDPDPGLWSCCLTVGKLNFSLGYSSILSVALLYKQMQLILFWAEDKGKLGVISHSPETIEDLPEINLRSRYELYAKEMKRTIIGMLPEKRVEVGVLIAGPHIEISLKREGCNGSNEDMNRVSDRDDFGLVFDACNVELALWPMPNSEFASSTGLFGLNDVESQSLNWKAPEIVDTPKSEGENYKSQSRISLSSYLKINGLNASWEGLDQNQEHKILVLKPITMQSSSFR